MMFFLVDIPTSPEEARGWVLFFIEYAQIIVGFVGGWICKVVAERMGWIKAGDAVENAVLKKELEVARKEITKHIEEGKTFRMFKERQIDNWINTLEKKTK